MSILPIARCRCAASIITGKAGTRTTANKSPDIFVQLLKAKTQQLARIRKNRVLIVNYHVMVRDGTGAIIEKTKDFTVCGTASTTREALEVLRKLKPDLVLVDITLPGKSGVQFVHEACAMYPDLRVLVMSARDESLYARRVLCLGARGYIQKRESSADLIAAMQRVMRGEIAVSKNATACLLETFSGRKIMHSPLEGLTDREMTVFQQLGLGTTTKQIAEGLHVSSKTVEAHRVHIKKKLGVTSAAELIAYAARWSEALG